MVLIAFILFSIYGIVGFTITLITNGVTSRTKRKSPTINSKIRTIREWNRSTAIDGLIAMAYVNNILGSFRRTIFWNPNSGLTSIIYYSLLYRDPNFKKSYIQNPHCELRLGETARRSPPQKQLRRI